MDKSGAAAFVYAKASGMLARSFIGERTAKLFEPKSLSELWTLVFDDEVPVVPEIMLARQLELKARQKFISDFSMLLGCFTHPEPVALVLLRFYDYCNLKDILHAARNGKTSLPELADIGSFSMLNYKAYPDIKAVTEGSPLSWVEEVPSVSAQKDLDFMMDRHYIKSLWDAVEKVPVLERQPVKKLIQEEISLKNCIWAIRLKLYYEMGAEEIKKILVSEGKEPSLDDKLSGEAVRILDFSPDSYDDWADWRYADLLNPFDVSEVWTADPRWIEQKARVYLNKKALKQFHLHPFQADVLVSWFKIKQYELDCIRTAAEALRLSADEEQVKEFVGIER